MLSGYLSARAESIATASSGAPVPVSAQNLGLVIEAGWAPRAAVCLGVAAGRVQACN